MSPLTLCGLVAGLAAVGAYLALAHTKKRQVDLAAACQLVFSVVSAMGAVRIFGFVLTDQISVIVASTTTKSWWSLSGEDSIYLMIGGLALAWTSVQTVWTVFADLRDAPKAPT